ncbi:MAG TPA: methyltransferase [Phycisphaerae bacterium]
MTITTTAPRATEIGHLLHKHPETVFERELTFGKAWVFYPEAHDERTTCALLLEVDPIGLVRGRGAAGMDQYVNDWPYVAGSHMAVALGACFGSALAGNAKEKIERLTERWPLEVHIPALSCRAGEGLIREFFEPLGYTVDIIVYPLDERFAEWGNAHVFSVRLTGAQPVRALVNHLYVLLPALDAAKHYYVGEDEVDKLLRKGEEWLADHPQRDLIVRRYLKYKFGLTRLALSRLMQEQVDEEVDPDAEEMDLEHRVDDALACTSAASEPPTRVGGDVRTSIACASHPALAGGVLSGEAPVNEIDDERAPRLHELRLATVLGVLRDPRRAIRSAIDLGCGEGRFLRILLKERQLMRVVGLDVSPSALQRCERRVTPRRLPAHQRERISILHGSLLYRDERLAGFDAATLIEVIEHIEPGRLPELERVLFEHARPRNVIITTPNAEYNVVWPTLPANKLRHRDHRFEWTRQEFREWCGRVGERFGYAVALYDIGPISAEHPTVGTPTQMAMFAY